MLHSHCLLAPMQDTRVVFPDIAPAAPLASHASAMSMSLSLGVFPIVPPIGLLPSWVAIVASLLVVASCCWHSRSASFRSPGVPEVSFWGQFDARNRMPMSICCPLPMLLSYFEVSVFWSSPRLFANQLNCVDFCARSLLLMRRLSSDGPGVLGVLFQDQFVVRNRSPVSAFRLLSS